ncbi:MAG TPA: hypothetical protein DCS15_10970 [Flavobacteriales bacterium]|nr:hypothetical protein [Flavobacteriales bacterium]
MGISANQSLEDKLPQLHRSEADLPELGFDNAQPLQDIPLFLVLIYSSISIRPSDPISGV